MLFKDFKDIHTGKKIIVCASGESMKNLLPCEYREIKLNKDVILLGVSHVNRYIQTDYLVCIDAEVNFIETGYDFNEVANTKAKYVFTQVPDMRITHAKKVIFNLGKNDGTSCSEYAVDYTNNTAYVACLIAHYMNPSKLGMLGNDFTGHKDGATELAKKYLNEQYEKLKNSFGKQPGYFVNLSDKSLIKTVPYQPLNEFLKCKN
jgi:hypothetical protein